VLLLTEVAKEITNNPLGPKYALLQMCEAQPFVAEKFQKSNGNKRRENNVVLNE
jgi:hypothetical protein